MSVVARENCRAWWRHHGFDFNPLGVDSGGRAWFPRTEAISAAIHLLAISGVLRLAWSGNHGPSVESGYRETVARASAQLVLHGNAAGGIVEMDFDRYNPTWDVARAVSHGVLEVVPGWFGRRTDAVWIAEELRKRGVIPPSAP